VVAPDREAEIALRKIDDGRVWSTGLSEQRRYALHLDFGYQIWGIKTPHVLGRPVGAPFTHGAGCLRLGTPCRGK
jgi:hypothetical protein